MNRMTISSEKPSEAALFGDNWAGAVVGVSDTMRSPKHNPEHGLVVVDDEAGLEVPVERTAGSNTSTMPSTMPNAKRIAVLFV